MQRVRIVENIFEGRFAERSVDARTAGELKSILGIESAMAYQDGKLLQDDDLLDEGRIAVLKIVPEGTATAVLIGAVAVAALCVGVGIYYLLKSAPPMKQIQPSPSLRGSSNSARRGERLPILLGRHRVYPDVAALPFSSYDGDNQHLHQLFCFGYRDVHIDESTLKIGETLLSSYDGWATEQGIGTIYPSRVVESSYSLQIKHGSPVIRSTASGSYKIEVGIIAPSGLYRYDGDQKEDATVGLRIEWRVPGGSWQTAHDVSRTRNCDRYREMFPIIPSGSADGIYEVRVSRTTAQGDSATHNDAVYLDVIKSFTRNPSNSSDKPVLDESRYRLLALKVKATDQLNGVADEINAVCTLVARSYNGDGTGPASWIASQTRNPASAILYLLTSSDANPSPVADSLIDWVAFESFHRFCEGKGFTCDAWVTGEFTVRQLCEYIAGSNMAELRVMCDRISIRIDQPQSGVVQMFTPRNAWGFHMERSFRPKPVNAVVKYNDAETGYVEVERIVSVTPEGKIAYDSRQDGEDQQVDLFGVTSSRHAAVVGALRMKELYGRSRTYSWNSDIEGIVCLPGDVVLIENDNFLLGLGEGRIKQVHSSGPMITGILLDSRMRMDAGESYGVRIRTKRRIIQSIKIVTNPGFRQRLDFEQPLDAEDIEIGDLAAFGRFETEAHEVLVTEMTQNQHRSCSISAVDYAEDAYSEEDSIPEYKSGISRYPDDGGAVGEGIVYQAPSSAYPIKQGEPGIDGKGISAITELYLASDASEGITLASSGWTASVQLITASKRYLWRYAHIEYTDGTSTDTIPAVIGVYGDPGSSGQDAVSVEMDTALITIPVDIRGKAIAAQSYDAAFRGWRGHVQQPCTASIGTLPHGMTAAIGPDMITFSVAKDAELGGVLAGAIDVTLACRGLEFERLVSWVKTVDPQRIQQDIQDNAQGIEAANGQITSLTSELAAKAAQSDLDALDGEVEDNAAAISGLATRVASAEGTITAHGTQISQNATEIQSKASQTEVDTLSGTVDSHGTQITQQAGQISSLATRVTATENTNTSQQSQITQNANQIATKVTQTQVDAAIANAKSANHGYRYHADIVLYGESDKFYPVVIKLGNQDVKREILVSRGYSEQAPSDWNTSTHRGGLTLKIKCNFGGWGGASYSWEIVDLEETYSIMFSGAMHVLSCMGFAIFLRGGGNTGAKYHLYSDQPLDAALYGIGSPQICYNQDSLGVTGEYHWEAPPPRAMKNSAPGSNALLDQHAEEIRIRRITKLAQANDTRLKNAETSITQNANAIALKASSAEVDAIRSTAEQHTAQLEVQAGQISQKITAVRSDGSVMAEAQLAVEADGGSTQIRLDADRVLISGSVKADKIDLDDLAAQDILLKENGALHSARYDRNGSIADPEIEKGTYIGADGQLKAFLAELESVLIKGRSIFQGEISSDVLSTSLEDKPGDPITSIPFPVASACSYKCSALREFIRTRLTPNIYASGSFGTYDGKTVVGLIRSESSNPVTLQSGSVPHTEGGVSSDKTRTFTSPAWPAYIQLNASGIPWGYEETSGHWTHDASSGSGNAVPSSGSPPSNPSDGDTYITISNVEETGGSPRYTWTATTHTYHETTTYHTGTYAVGINLNGASVQSGSWIYAPPSSTITCTFHCAGDACAAGSYTLKYDNYKHYGSNVCLIFSGWSKESIPASGMSDKPVSLTISGAAVRGGSGQSSWSNLTPYSQFKGLRQNGAAVSGAFSIHANNGISFTDDSGTTTTITGTGGTAFASSTMLSFSGVAASGGGNGWSTAGKWFSAWSVSFVPVSIAEGVHVSDLRRKSAASTIGTEDKPFYKIYATELHGVVVT